ncbi:MAG: transglutaminase domain-containing protein [Calditrichota bacterium]
MFFLNIYRKKSMTLSKLSWWALYLVWFFMVGALFLGILKEPKGGLRAPDELLSGVSLTAESSWMGIYLSGQKVGYIHTEIEPRNEGGYEIREYSRLNASMMGTAQQMRMRMNVITDSTLALVSFNGQLEAEPYDTQFEGEIKASVLSISMTTAGKTTDKFIPAPEPIYLSQAIKPLLQAGRLGSGDSLKLAGFDPLSLEMQDLVVIGAPLQLHRLWGNDVMTRKLTTRLSGLESALYVDEFGNTLGEFGPMGMVLRREDMQMALDDGGGDRSQVDFLAIYAVKPIGELRAPRRASVVRYRVIGVSLEHIVAASDRQTIIDPDSGLIEVTDQPEIRPANTEKLKKYKRDAPFIESREKSIRLAALTAVDQGKSRADSLAKLTHWVFKAVRKRPAAGIPSALAVLQMREGDCNEHSVLFTAMARSLGIPTRIQMGVVYQGGSFYYHAWPAAWVDGAWMECDPTFGQETADAARIALVSGDLSDAVSLASVIGRLSIEIIKER